MHYSMHNEHVRGLLAQALSHVDHEERGLAHDLEEAECGAAAPTDRDLS